jgi:hypothetical protein
LLLLCLWFTEFERQGTFYRNKTDFQILKWFLLNRFLEQLHRCVLTWVCVCVRMWLNGCVCMVGGCVSVLCMCVWIRVSVDGCGWVCVSVCVCAYMLLREILRDARQMIAIMKTELGDAELNYLCIMLMCLCLISVVRQQKKGGFMSCKCTISGNFSVIVFV